MTLTFWQLRMSDSNNIKQAVSVSTCIEYRKLDVQIKEIRLLSLFPSPNSDPSTPVKCTLEYHPLAEAPPYTALSYQRGDTDDTVPIVIGCKTSKATRSLDGALRALRARNIERVWADAICIYVDRSRSKYRRNLRIKPLFREGFGFLSERKNLRSVFQENFL
jgi:Heterokaryon incompatibility protein (HET)